jgi:hypothetical protein
MTGIVPSPPFAVERQNAAPGGDRLPKKQAYGVA